MAATVAATGAAADIIATTNRRGSVTGWIEAKRMLVIAGPPPRTTRSTSETATPPIAQGSLAATSKGIASTAVIASSRASLTHGNHRRGQGIVPVRSFSSIRPRSVRHPLLTPRNQAARSIAFRRLHLDCADLITGNRRIAVPIFVVGKDFILPRGEVR